LRSVFIGEEVDVIKKPNIYQPPDTSRVEALAGSPLAPFTRRALALFIDVIAAALSFALVAVFIMKLDNWIGTNLLKPDLHIEFSFYENWYSLIWLVLYFTLSVYLSNGRTLGKKLLRLRIISQVHERISLFHSFERALGYGASALEAGFGFFQYFIRPDRRTIHDRIAETIVVTAAPKKMTKAKKPLEKSGREEE
jgi:uncharacterized RDD family membrane protein YckC